MIRAHNRGIINDDPIVFGRRQVLAGILAAGLTPLLASAQPLVPTSLEKQIGRMLVLGFYGSRPDEAGPAHIEKHLHADRIGGVLFLGHNIQSRKGTEGLVARFRAAKSDAWLALDHEGGYVQRLDETLGYAAIPKAGDVAQIGLDEARSIYKKAADAFADAGFNFNLAPIADLHHDRNTIIGTYRRAYGSDPEIIAAYCTAFIDAYKRRGVACALKHFPGHGRSSKDSHHGLVDLTDSWTMEEAAPFGDLIRNGRAHAIMSGHLVNRHLDPTGAPATLSRPILQGLLRQKMQFEGVIMTDDLDMAGVRKQYSRRQAVIASIAAGNDLIVISNTIENDPSLPERIVEWVDEAITSGELDPETIVTANARLNTLARDLGRI